MYAESVFQYLKLTYWYDTNVIPWKYFEFVIGGENLEKQYPTSLEVRDPQSSEVIILDDNKKVDIISIGDSQETSFCE